MSENLLEVKNLKKYYRREGSRFYSEDRFIKSVDDVSLSIKEGETFGLVGESGCGKSTLAKVILGLEQPDEGEIFFRGSPLHLRERGRRILPTDIRLIFQDSLSALNPTKRIGWLLEESLRIDKTLTAEEKKRSISEMMEAINFDETLLDRYPHELSGGQSQRVGILLALLNRPRFIIADEPVSALDVSTQSTLLNLLKTTQKKFNLTYLFISHNLDVIESMSDRVGVMYQGKIVEMGRAEDLYRNPQHPYTQLLIDSIPRLNRSSERSLQKESRDLTTPPLPNREGCAFYPRCSHRLSLCEKVSPLPQLVGESHQLSCHLNFSSQKKESTKK